MPPGSIWFMPSEKSQASLVIDGLLEGTRPATTSQGGFISFVRRDGTSGIISLPEGDVVYTAPNGMVVSGVSDDGSLVVIREPMDEVRAAHQESIVLAIGTGQEIGRIPTAEVQRFSPDSSLLFEFCCGNYGPSSLYRLPQMDVLATVSSFFTKITDGGELLALTPHTETGRVWLIDVDALRESKDLESSRIADIDAQSGSVFLDFSADGLLLATTGFDEPIKIWDIAGVLDGSEQRLIAEIDAGHRVGPPLLAFRPDGTRILSKASDGKLRQFVVHTDDLLAIAVDRLTRGLTPGECEQFGIESCRTLEEMRTATGT
jgi:WD40 repeat protein